VGDLFELVEQEFRRGRLADLERNRTLHQTATEAALKMMPLVGQAIAIGDQRPFVSALVVLDPDVAPQWAAGKGIEFESLEALAEHPEVIAEIEGGLAGAMEGFNNAERVKKVKILGEEWLPDSDVLTPTSKLKRRGITARYADQIEAIYG
jgi:long-chain acyl-CoA synthetase